METKNNCVKKILFSLFVILLPMLASAEKVEIGGIWYNLDEGSKQAEVTYKGSSYNEYGGEYSGSITIPAKVTHEGEEYGVTSIGDYAFAVCGGLTDITLPESVTSIGNSAFWYCRYFTTITLPENSQLTSIGNSAFDECISLTSITIPESVTSIEAKAFSTCSSLATITIPENLQLTSIGTYAFEGCSSLTSITIPESVTSIEAKAFQYCSSLTNVHISDIAAWCNIKFYDKDSNPLVMAKKLYLNGELVTELTLPESVTSIGDYAFYNCSSLTAITIPENSQLTSIGNSAFCECISLATITIPENSQLTSIGSSAFHECSSLTSITLPESVTKIGSSAFYGCTGELTVNCNIPSAPSYSRYGAFYNGKFTKVTIGESVTSIGNCAFYECISLISITFPDSVTSIGSSAFEGCSNLTSITIPESVTSIGSSAFAGCSNLTSITIPECVTSIRSGVFKGCSSLTSIILPEGVTNIGSSAFYECISLTAITFPEGIWRIDDSAFSGCSSLTTITIPKNSQLTGVGRQVFNNCSSLTNVYCFAERVPTTETDAFDNSNIVNATLHVPASVLNAYKTTAPWSSFGNIVPFGAAITKITLDKTLATLTEGDELTLAITTTPDDADMNLISWSSNNPSVATVDNTGKVTAVAPGTATITAMANDDSGVSASCEVTVAGRSYTITYLVDSEVYHRDTINHGSAIEPIEMPTKEGHTFSGWSEIPETMPANNLVIEGSFTINSYTITYMIDGRVYKIVTYKFGDLIIPLDVPQETEYIFSGWVGLPETMPAKDLIVIGAYAGIDGSHSDDQGVKYSLKESKDGYTVTGIAANPSSDIVIPAEVKGLPVTAIGERAFVAVRNLKSIVIPSNITVVGDDAFYSCKDLLVVEWNTAAPVRAECFDKAENHGNMLVFVNDANTEVSYKGNVIVEGVAEQITISDDMAFRSPQQFTARNISFTREFTKKTKIGVSGGWEAMVLPFDVQSVVSKNRGELKPFGEADFITSLPYWLGELQADGTFATTNSIKANKPFIMQLPNSDEYEDRYNVEGEVTFSATNVMVYPTTDMEQEVGNGYVMLGSYEGTTADSRVYALNDEEYTADGATYMPGGVFVANSRDIRPFEAYVYTTSAGRAPYLRVGKETTGVVLSTVNGQQTIEIYDLTGRKVLKTENLKGGVYIVNGRKVVIK